MWWRNIYTLLINSTTFSVQNNGETYRIRVFNCCRYHLHRYSIRWRQPQQKPPPFVSPVTYVELLLLLQEIRCSAGVGSFDHRVHDSYRGSPLRAVCHYRTITKLDSIITATATLSLVCLILHTLTNWVTHLFTLWLTEWMSECLTEGPLGRKAGKWVNQLSSVLQYQRWRLQRQ